MNQLERKFREYHRNNPHVYDLLVKFAVEAKKAGHLTYSIWAVANRVRWHVNITTQDPDGFKISNNHMSRYSRLIMEQEKYLKGFFRIKALRS